MDIYSSVGKSGMNKPSDVALVQAALINHKDGQFWRGPIDGKVGLGINDRIDNAIIAFQQHHKFPVTGKLTVGGKDTKQLRDSLSPKYRYMKVVRGSTAVFIRKPAADSFKLKTAKEFLLPRAEATELATNLKDCLQLLKLPVDITNTAINNDGRFEVKLAVKHVSWVGDNRGQFRNNMPPSLLPLLGEGFKDTRWNVNFDKPMVFTTVNAFGFLKGANKNPSADFMKTLDIAGLPSDATIRAMLGGLEKSLSGAKPNEVKASMKLCVAIAEDVDDRVAGALTKQERKLVPAPRKSKVLINNNVHMQDVESVGIIADDMWVYLEFEIVSMGDGMTAGNIAPFIKHLKKKIVKTGGEWSDYLPRK